MDIFSFHKRHREYSILFSDFGVREGDFGAEPDAVGSLIFDSFRVNVYQPSAIIYSHGTSE